MLAHDLIFLAWTYFILFLLQLMSLPVVFYLSKKFSYLKDAGWGFGRIFSILLLSLLVWNLAFLKIPINTDLGVSFLFFCLSLLSLYFSWGFFLSKKNFLKDFVQKFGKVIIIEEIIFLVSLIFLFVTRSFQPEILGLEKFMDAGFIQAYLKSPTLPAQDIWFANSNINYYSFGQFYNAILVHLWRVDLAYGYNLLLITLFAIFCLELFSVAFNFRANLGKYNFKACFFAGLFAIFLVALGANGHTLWYFFKNGGTNDYWYPDATRFIDRTIHEFPAYSFVVCDLHAHVLSLPISLLLLLVIFIWLKEIFIVANFKKLMPLVKEKFIFLSLIMGVLFGVLVMTNTWDVMIYGFLLIIISLFVLFKNKSVFLPLFFSAACVFIGTAFFSMFWFLNFTPISAGLAIAKEHTPFWQLLVLWGPHLFWACLLLFLIKSYFSTNKNDLALPIFLIALFFLVSLLIIFPELFYFKDIYTTYPRANTMFKLVFQGFMFLGILLSLFFSLVLFEIDKKHYYRILWYFPIGFFLFFSTLVYPYLAYKSYYNGLKNYQGLNGLAWFARKYPEDFVLMNYLKQNEKKQINIVEAVGESYTEFARISAFSGMSTVLGWRVHEWLWRASWDEPGKRSSEVEKIYLSPRSTEADSYLKKYQIKYIVIGDKEFEAYKKIDVQGLLSLGKIVVQEGNHYLIQLF